MKKRYLTLLLLSVFCIIHTKAQDSTAFCKVLTKGLSGRYTGECKKGLAHGKGEATGIQHYIGNFKYGLPDGKGIYYYNDSVYHEGSFQAGIKEGKGEAHFIRKGLPDSIVKGYWSGDLYRGKRYITYDFDGEHLFDRSEISPSEQIGNTLTIVLSSTSGSPNGAANSFLLGGPGFNLSVANITALNGEFILKRSGYDGAYQTSVTYELSKFPIRLLVTLSNNRTFYLELYKAATWTVRLFNNK